VEQVLYDQDGNPLPANPLQRRLGQEYIKGTLFFQRPQLDGGPPIATVLSPIMTGLCAYQAREELYHGLTTLMLQHLPVLLDPVARKELVEQKTHEKKSLDAMPNRRVVPELEPDKFARWQGRSTGIDNPSKRWGIEVIQNEIIDPNLFK